MIRRRRFMSSSMSDLKFKALGEGPDVVMLHGWAMSSGIWGQVTERLSAHFRLTLIDLPGHGMNAGSDIASLDELFDAIRRIAPTGAVWLGWSLGGMIALAFTRRFPGMVSGVITVGANLKFCQSEDWPHAMPVSDFDAFAAAVLVDPTEAVKRFVALQSLGGGMSGSEVRALQASVLSQLPSKAGLQFGLALLGSLDLREDLCLIEQPVLAIFGARDRIVPFPVSSDWQILAKNLRTRVIAGSGHAPFLTHPQPFGEELDSFMGIYGSSI